jgi:hypothetical protein
MASAITQVRKIAFIDGLSLGTGSTIEHQAAHTLPILILTYQIPHIFIAGAKAPAVNLLIDKCFEGFRQEDVHRAHGMHFSESGKIRQE